MSISESRLRGIIREEASRLLEQAGPEVGTTGAADVAVSTGPREYVFSVKLQADAPLAQLGAYELNMIASDLMNAIMKRQAPGKPVKVMHHGNSVVLKQVR